MRSNKADSIYIYGVPERGEREREKGPKRLLKEVIAENFSNLAK